LRIARHRPSGGWPVRHFHVINRTLITVVFALPIAQQFQHGRPISLVVHVGLHRAQTCDGGATTNRYGNPFRSIFLSDVCKHCANAGCLEACPTGAIVRTNIGSVLVQSDVCSACGYCVVSCPFGVVDRRHPDGRAFKCTFCYDRQSAGMIPECAKARPTQSIRLGELDELREAGDIRVAELQRRGYTNAQMYDPLQTSVDGAHGMFVIWGSRMHTTCHPRQKFRPST
jgi:Fe-S-cluster-containing dehydrogenase component